jgi:hypothetical protein
VVGVGLVGLVGLVGVGVVSVGVVGVVGVGVVGVVDGEVGRVVLGAGVGVVGCWVADRVGSGSGATQGGAGLLGDADGLSGTNGLPTGSFGLVFDLDVPCVPCVRSVLGAAWDEGGAWVDAVSCDRNGIRNRAPAVRARAAAPMVNFRTGVRRRMCRGLDCLTTQNLSPPGRKGAYRLERFNRSSP